MYCSLPAPNSLLPDPYFAHYALPVTSVYILMGEYISQDCLLRAEQYLEHFYSTSAKLYGMCNKLVLIMVVTILPHHR